MSTPPQKLDNKIPDYLQDMISEGKIKTALKEAEGRYKRAKQGSDAQRKWQGIMTQIRGQVKRGAKEKVGEKRDKLKDKIEGAKGSAKEKLEQERDKREEKDAKKKEKDSGNKKKPKPSVVDDALRKKVKGTISSSLTMSNRKKTKSRMGNAVRRFRSGTDNLKNKIKSNVENKVLQWLEKNDSVVFQALAERQLGRWVEEAKKTSTEHADKVERAVTTLMQLTTLTEGKFDVSGSARDKFDLNKLNVLSKDENSSQFEIDDDKILDVANSQLGKIKHIMIEKVPEKLRPAIYDKGEDYLVLEKLDYGEVKGIKNKIKRGAKDFILDFGLKNFGSNKVKEVVSEQDVSIVAQPLEDKFKESRAWDTQYGQNVTDLLEYLDENNFQFKDLGVFLGDTGMGFTKNGQLRVGNPTNLIKGGLKNISKTLFDDNDREEIQNFLDRQIFDKIENTLNPMVEQITDAVEEGESLSEGVRGTLTQAFENAKNPLDKVAFFDEWFRDEHETYEEVESAFKSAPYLTPKEENKLEHMIRWTTKQQANGKNFDKLEAMKKSEERPLLVHQAIKQVKKIANEIIKSQLMNEDIKDELIIMKRLINCLTDREYRKAMHLQKELTMVTVTTIDPIIENLIAENIHVFIDKETDLQLIINSYKESFGETIVKRVINSIESKKPYTKLV